MLLKSGVLNNMEGAFREQYGTIKFDQLPFDLRFKTSWVFQNFIWLLEMNREFAAILRNTLDITEQNKSEYIAPPPRFLSVLLMEGKSIDEIIEIIKDEDIPNYGFSENAMNRLGYDLMG